MSPNTTQARYFEGFRDQLLVVSADRLLADDPLRQSRVLGDLAQLVRHGLRVLLVYGEGQACRDALLAGGAKQHGETSKLAVPTQALSDLAQRREHIAKQLGEVAARLQLPLEVLPAEVAKCEPRAGHLATGAIRGFEIETLHAATRPGQLAVIGFGGTLATGQFCYVSADALATEIAVALGARKLLLLDESGALQTPTTEGDRPVSFLDLEQLLCLLQRTNRAGQHVLAGERVALVHCAIRAVAGGVEQVHVVADWDLLPELATRTGAGTLIERHQTHVVVRATSADLADIVDLHQEGAQATTDRGTPLVVPLDAARLAALLPHTWVLKHRGVVVAKLHAPPLEGEPTTAVIGGFCVGENHQHWQHGRLLLGEVLVAIAGRGFNQAIAVTASPRAAAAFSQWGAPLDAGAVGRLADLLARSRARYHVDERGAVRLMVMPLPPEG